MKNKLLMLSLVAAVAAPGLAMAQPYQYQPQPQGYVDPACVRQNKDNKTTGTILGALGGAIVGSAVAGRHDRGTGAVIGGVGGAVIGNNIARSNNHPCPEGYYYPAQNPPPPAYAPPPPAYAPPPPAYAPPPAGYDRERWDREHREGYDRGPGRFWAGAPYSLHERIDFLQQRINESYQNRWIGRREYKAAMNDLSDIRRQDRRLRYQDGGELRPQDRDYIQQRLDNLSQRLRWFEHN